jgi:predicted Zn-dependent peptidase
VRARRYLSGNHLIDEQRNAAHAAHLSLDGLYDLGPASYAEYPAAIEAVTKEDLLRVARRVLKLDAYTIAWVGP